MRCTGTLKHFPIYNFPGSGKDLHRNRSVLFLLFTIYHIQNRLHINFFLIHRIFLRFCAGYGIIRKKG